jgi:hypothetical protein
MARMVTAFGAAGTVLIGATVPALAAVTPATLTLSSTQGPNTGGNTITATIPASAGVTFSPGVDVEFQAAAGASTSCTATYAPPVTPTPANGGIIDHPNVLVISGNRVAINVQGFGVAPTTAKYNVCVYSANNANGQLLAQTTSAGQYTIGAKVMLNGVWPIAGPSQGGTVITVTGNNFPTAATTPPSFTATLGGLPLQNITLISPNSFTAVTPSRSPSAAPVPLIVTSTSGMAILGRAFTYANGITVMPDSGSSARMGGTPVDVQGIGFGALAFQNNGNPDDKNSHVYLVRGTYDPSNNNGSKRNGAVAECTFPTVVSDTELICTLNLQASLSAAGTTALPSRTITADTASNATLANIAPPLSAADQGMRISGSGIAPGTTITGVGNGGTSATLSNATQATAQGVTGIALGIGSQTATVSGATNGPNQPPHLTGISPALTQADIGKAVTGTGIAPGTTIMGIGADGTTAYLSAPNTSAATGTPGTVMISEPMPVPVGTYTLTVVSNGTLNAWPSDPNYTQSVVSSGSTFTVSDF